MNWLSRRSGATRRAQAEIRQRNQRAQLGGCRCGASATHVRYFDEGVGVAAEVWACEAHRDVNTWELISDGSWRPLYDYDPETLASEVSPPITRR